MEFIDPAEHINEKMHTARDHELANSKSEHVIEHEYTDPLDGQQSLQNDDETIAYQHRRSIMAAESQQTYPTIHQQKDAAQNKNITCYNSASAPDVFDNKMVQLQTENTISAHGGGEFDLAMEQSLIPISTIEKETPEGDPESEASPTFQQNNRDNEE